MSEDFNPRLLKTASASYILAEWDGTNRSGITPLGDRVLVLVDAAAEKTGGGLLLTEQMVERTTLASTTGLLVAVGPGAFSLEVSRGAMSREDIPKAGERVCFQRYAGQEYQGFDGRLYRLMSDTAIGGVMKPVPLETGRTAGVATVMAEGGVTADV